MELNEGEYAIIFPVEVRRYDGLKVAVHGRSPMKHWTASDRQAVVKVTAESHDQAIARFVGALEKLLDEGT